MVEPPSKPERVFDALRRAHLQFTGTADSEADLPAWYALTPAGPIRIKTIGTFGPFVQFVTPEEHVLLVMPEAVVVRMQKLAPESEEPRFKIGFS